MLEYFRNETDFRPFISKLWYEVLEIAAEIACKKESWKRVRELKRNGRKLVLYIQYIYFFNTEIVHTYFLEFTESNAIHLKIDKCILFYNFLMKTSKLF